MSALEEVRDLAEAVVGRRSLLLWDVEIGGQPGRSMVRVLVDGDEGVDLDTVAQVSEEISRGLDLKDPIPGRYTLEVSTPGLERPLKTPDHFQRSTGKRVMVKTAEKLLGDSHRIDGVLAVAGDTSVQIDVDGEPVEVPYEAIRAARTVFEWK